MGEWKGKYIDAASGKGERKWREIGKKNRKIK